LEQQLNNTKKYNYNRKRHKKDETTSRQFKNINLKKMMMKKKKLFNMKLPRLLVKLLKNEKILSCSSLHL